MSKIQNQDMIRTETMCRDDVQSMLHDGLRRGLTGEKKHQEQTVALTQSINDMIEVQIQLFCP
jgi:hypothetical protein